MRKLLMVVPTYNEIENIPELINQLTKKTKADILVVDDNSPDATAAFVKKAMKKNKRLNLLERAGKLGLGSAYIAGMKFGFQHKYEYIGTMDADFSHNPGYIPAMFDLVEKNGADVVIGSRYVPGGAVDANWPKRRILLSFFANALARILVGVKTRDNTSGFRIYKAELLKKIDPDLVKSSGYSFLTEFIFRCKLQNAIIAEYPIIFTDRTLGNSKISKKEIYKAILTLFYLFYLRITGKK
jgi:dolichol-phosphate mannosyltransferase